MMRIKPGRFGGKMLAAAAAIVLDMAAQAACAKYPDQPITLVVPYAPGGAVDIVGRIVGRELSQALGQSVIVENKSGFGGNIGAQWVKNAPHDGYTLLMAATTSFALNGKLLGKKAVGYDLAKDFRAVSMVGELPILLVVNQSLQIHTLAQLVAKLKAAPDKYSFGSSGNGTIEHVVGEMFRLLEGVKITHVPYRGAAPAMTDLMSGQIQLMFATSPTALASVASGRADAIGVASLKRLPSLPNVPTLDEQGLKGFTAQSVYGLLAPAGTPDSVVNVLNAALSKALATDSVRDQFAKQGVSPLINTPQQAAGLLRDEVQKWNHVIDETGIKVTQ